MLEFIIKLDGDQIGLLRFDSGKHSRDDAMHLLKWYVDQELSEPKLQTSSLANTGARINQLFHSPILEQAPTDIKEEASDIELGDKSTHNYLLINKRATNREHAAKYNRVILNGNMVATLVALCKIGGSIEEARDLLVILRDDARFNSNSFDEGTSNIRNSLNKLEGLKLVEKSEGGGHIVTEAGRRIGKDFDVPPKRELTVTE